ncbi:MAG: hypothetical protein ABIQ32_10700 [Sphingomicrobium sp.]
MQQSPSENSGTAEELRSDAQRITNSATQRIHSEVDARKGAAVDQAKSVSNAVQRAADGLDDNTPAWLKSAFQQGAEQIQRFADSIESKDSRQLLNDVQSFARQRPGLFLGAAAAAGFAAARIFKAGANQQDAEQFSGSAEWDRSEPWGSGEQDVFAQSGSSGNPLSQGQRSAADASSNEAFIARTETQSPTATEFQTQDEDPLTLGTGGEGGRRIRNEGELR